MSTFKWDMDLISQIHQHPHQSTDSWTWPQSPLQVIQLKRTLQVVSFFPLFCALILRTNSLGPGMVLMTHDKALKRCCCLNCNFLFVRGKGPSGLIVPFLLRKTITGNIKNRRSPHHTPERETSTVYIFPEMKKGLDRSVSSQSSLGASCCTS